MLPLVSVGIASYNNARYIKQTLNSIYNQSYRGPLEIIVVDDYSTDNSIDIIESWHREVALLLCEFPRTFYLIRNEVNKGVCAVCNIIIHNSNGKYVTLIGSDDLKTFDSVAQQVNLFEKEDETVGVVYSNTYLIDALGDLIPGSYVSRFGLTVKSGWVFRDLLYSTFVPASSAMIRRAVYEKVGDYDESLSFEDWDMWLRIAQKYQFIYMPECTSYYRIHDAQWSNSLRPSAIDTVFRVLNKFTGISSEIDTITKFRKDELAEEIYAKYGASIGRKWLFRRSLDHPSIKNIIFFTGSLFGLPHSFLVRKKVNKKQGNGRSAGSSHSD